MVIIKDVLTKKFKEWVIGHLSGCKLFRDSVFSPVESGTWSFVVRWSGPGARVIPTPQGCARTPSFPIPLTLSGITDPDH